MRFSHKVLTAFVLGTTALNAGAIETSPDSLACVADSAAVTTVAADSVRHSNTYWIKQLWDNGFHINAPGVEYPRFPRFLLKVYNWGDRIFNGYDPDYVVSTGKNWKILGKSYNWQENYSLLFSHGNLHIVSDIYADIGGYLCFMAVSVGYMFNANEIIGDKHDTRTNFNFNFTCSRFWVDFQKTSTRGGARVFKRHQKSVPFEDISNKMTQLSALYFFNNRRYSHAAAYCFSKYQLKSAGSWIAGFLYSRQDISMDFNDLPPEVLEGLPETLPAYRFNYSDYTLTGGYAYNWALRPRRWLFNVTAALGFGLKHAHENNSDNTDSNRSLLASNGQLSLGLVYNHRALFAGLQVRGIGHFYFNSNYTFLNALSSATLTVGARF